MKDQTKTAEEIKTKAEILLKYTPYLGSADITYKNILKAMEEYASQRKPTRTFIDDEIEALAKEDCLSLSSIPAWIRGFKKCLFKCYGKT